MRDTANYDLEGIDYDIRICDSPKEMEHIVKIELETERVF
ncbi:MAG: hypothetical protein SOX33_00995 [Agathobacter sp.]|nr:hypothetical protein [Agathobacter sp.]